MEEYTLAVSQSRVKHVSLGLIRNFKPNHKSHSFTANFNIISKCEKLHLMLINTNQCQ